MVKLKIIDNFLDLNLIKILETKFLYQTPHFYGHRSKTNGPEFYSSNLDSSDTLIKYIHSKISDTINTPTLIARSYLNIQFQEMGGEFHIDDGDITALLMVTKTPKQGGEFEYYKENTIKQIPYLQNRLILFSGIEHRGTSPKDNTPRITLAYKLNIVK